MLILGGLVAMLGTTDRVMDVVAALQFARPECELSSRINILLMIGVFVYTFFKFAWSIRQYHFCTVLVGAAPVTKEPPGCDEYVDMMTKVASHAAEDLNQGLRAFYFAFAAVAWFFHPWLFAASSAVVVYTLYQREFQSSTLRALTGLSTIGRSLHLPEGRLASCTSMAALPEGCSSRAPFSTCNAAFGVGIERPLLRLRT
jgi:uncharacterized membrane protein